MKTITKYIYNQVAANQMPLNEAKEMLKELQDVSSNNQSDIAIIGMAGKFPKAANLDEYWRNLTNGVNCIDDFPQARIKEWLEVCEKSIYARLLSKSSPEKNINGNNFVKGGYLDEVDTFDAAFFKISPKEAMYMDPLQRVFLETAYEAMEDAGYGGQNLYGAKVGIYVGKDHTNSTMYKYVTEPDEMQLTGNWTGILASRLSYIFNFRSPSMVIDTACSSGLVALYEACRALKNKECDVAIAGGVQVQIFTDTKDGTHSMGMVESSDDHVRTFDKNASGTIWGEGAGALILKPLDKAIADHDHVHAVIKGGAINNDGASSGIAAPNAEAQKELIIKAWKEAKIDPETISYIEAHGTGTNLGDPIEIKGITAAFEEFTTKKQFCGIGSVKTNVGHLVAASGLASVIKVVLALKNKEIPPSINFESPNPFINFLNSPVYVNDRPRPWNSTDDSPRRAGVSAFGFSGTNCHLILEEAPALAEKEKSQHQPGILAISARNKNVLRDYLNRYHDFLERTPDANLGNICYSANTGRGHYNYRIALDVANLEDLKIKIARLKAADPEEIREPGIYYGTYKIVPDHKTDRAGNELTEKERKQLSTAANQKLQEYSNTRVSELTAELCRLYVKGANIAWDDLYQDQGFMRISLPVYPLERIKCWAPPNTEEISGIQSSSKPIHPLLHRMLAGSLDLKIYATEFSVDNDWVLNEHRVLNYYIAPGTTYLEMARAASEAYYGDNPIELRDFLFINPLVVEPGEKKEVQTIVKKESEYLDFIVASQFINNLGDEQWSIHAQGKIYQVKSGKPGWYDLAELKTKLDVERNQIDVNESIGNTNFTFGPRWNNIIFGAGEKDQALVQIQLPEEFQDDLHEYLIHPALMDQAVDLFSQNIEGMRLPLMYKKMTIYDRMPANFYCYMRRKDQGTGNMETILWDATLFDESGQVFIEIEDYSLKRVRDKELKFTKPSDETLYYGFAWLPAELKVDAPVTADGTILVFKDERGIAAPIIQGLKAKGRDLVEVEMGTGYEQITENLYRIQGDEADYQQLVEALQGKKISQILHLMSMGKEPGLEDNLRVGVADLEQQQFKGLYSLFYLCRVLSRFNYPQRMDLVLIADNVNEITKEEDRINPVAGAFFGLGKTVFSENEQLKCRAIDIDRYTAPDKIIAEILTSGSTYQVAYRRNQRYIEEFQTVELQNKPGNHGIKDGGVYIITGGTGGVGLEIGKYLARKAKVKLALINRTPMPGRESWSEVVTRNEDQTLCGKITAILEMEHAGSEVLVFSADICSESSLEPVLNEIRQKYGRINGVIHAAGVAGAGFMFKKDIQIFENVVSPKIQGTWLLDKLTAADDLDFFILFSSIATITGAAGQSDYTAANSFLDSFSAYRNKHGKRTLCINWPLWEGVGMAAAYGATDTHLIFKAVSPAKALEVFEKLLSVKAPRVIFGELNYPMITAVYNDLPFKISDQIDTAIKKQKGRLTNRKKVSEGDNFQKAVIIGISNPDEEQTPYILAQIWARVLGLAEIDANMYFYDQGGDSILASQLLKDINREYPEVISISDIYSYSTVNELAHLIDQKGGNIKRKALITTPKTAEAKPVEAVKTEPLEIQETKAAEAVEPGIMEIPAAASAESEEQRMEPLDERSEEEVLTAGKSGDSADEIPESRKFPTIYRVNDRWPDVKLFQRDEPDAKELTIRLQREITIALHRCLPLQVVLTDERLYPWFYEHYVNIFSQIESDGNLKLDFLEEWGVYRSVIGEISLGAHYMARQPDIIAFIIDNINQGKYLNVCTDEYFLPRKMRTQRTHFIHHAFIYGYDNGKRELKTIGFNAENIIDQITFSYDEFRYAYERGKEYYKESAPWTSQTAVQLFFLNGFEGVYPFNIKVFLNKLYNYLHSIRENEIIYVWTLKEERVKYGFQVYDIVLEYFQKILQGDTKMDYRVAHLLYEHKTMIAKRLAYIIGRYNISGRMLQLYDAYLGIVEHFKTIRLKYYDLENRFSYRSPEPWELENAKFAIEQIIEKIKEGRETERILLTEIYELLNSPQFTD
jgi:iturin family lipopeptide synthetase A